MDGGSVTVASDGTVSMSGLAGALYSALSPLVLANLSAATLATVMDPATGQTVQTNVLQSTAAFANAIGPALVTYITANAVATILPFEEGRSAGTSCGAMPNSTDPGTPILPPAAAVALGIS